MLAAERIPSPLCVECEAQRKAEMNISMNDMLEQHDELRSTNITQERFGDCEVCDEATEVMSQVLIK